MILKILKSVNIIAASNWLIWTKTQLHVRMNVFDWVRIMLELGSRSILMHSLYKSIIVLPFI